VRRHEEALALAREFGDRAGEAAALTGQAFAAAFAGDGARAGALSEQALTVLREVGDTRGLAEVLVGVAMLAVHAGAYARGEVLGGEALALFRAMGDTGRIADTLWMLGVAAMFQGSGSAQRRSSRSAWRCTASAATSAAPSRHWGRSGRLRSTWAHARARAMLQEALEIARRHDDRWGWP
jgi:hypothetical protein